MAIAPIDFHACRARPGWRQAFAWPLRTSDARRAVDPQISSFLSHVASLDTADKAPVLLAGHAFLSLARGASELAVTLDAADAQGIEPIGDGPMFGWLTGRFDGDPPLIGASQRDISFINEAVRHRWLRRMARRASWTPWQRGYELLMPAKSVAVSHNDLLRQAAAQAGNRVGFVHGVDYLSAARRCALPADPDRALELANGLVRAMTGCLALSDDRCDRLTALLTAQARDSLSMALSDMTAFETLTGLPTRIWSGTGGKYAVRALGLEVIRRGGQVHRFDHTGTSGAMADPSIFGVIEYSVSTDFTAATSAVAEAISSEPAAVSPFQPCAIHSGTGYSDFERPARVRRPAHRAGPLKVLYSPAGMSGLQRNVPNGPSDAVKIDWQLRLIDLFDKLPYELTVKGHPEGDRGDHPDPLSERVAVTPAFFEDMMEAFDVFLFDATNTTALWKAVVSEVPIVVIDFDLYDLSPDVANALRNRISMVPVSWDDRCRATIDPDMLRDAIEAARAKTDPSWFRRRFLGDGRG